MRKNNKTIFFLSVILSLTMIFGGCGNVNKNDNKKPPKTETKILQLIVKGISEKHNKKYQIT